MLTQLPPLTCARGEKTQREERNGRVTVTCLVKGKKVRWITSEHGVRTSSEVGTHVAESFFEATGQRLSRESIADFGSTKAFVEQWWWPDGCVLVESSLDRGDLFSAECARQRRPAPDGGAGRRVVILPPGLEGIRKTDTLSTLGVVTEVQADGACACASRTRARADPARTG